MKYAMIILVAICLAAMGISQFKVGYDEIKKSENTQMAMLVEAGK